MNFFLRYSYIIPRYIFRRLDISLSYVVTYYKFKVFNVKFTTFKTKGIPTIDITGNGQLKIGENFKMNNGFKYNRIGRQQNCYFIISDGSLKIGQNVGISSCAFYCAKSITVGDNVRIGGNTTIYDTDFHSLDTSIRIGGNERALDIKTKNVVIGDNVFIGAHCTILKGVNIGANSVVGAGSVVSKSIPPNEIWAGNPASFIRSISV